MDFENLTPEMEEEMDNIICLTDEAGNECPFEFLDLLEYNGNEYAVLLPVDDEEGELVILQVEETEDEESYLAVEDEAVLWAVFEMFKEKFRDEFNFAD